MTNEHEIHKANYTKMEDIQNSQESIMEKIGVLQVELFNHPDNKLEKELNELTELAGKAYDKVKEISEKYKMEHNIHDQEFLG